MLEEPLIENDPALCLSTLRRIESLIRDKTRKNSLISMISSAAVYVRLCNLSETIVVACDKEHPSSYERLRRASGQSMRSIIATSLLESKEVNDYFSLSLSFTKWNGYFVIVFYVLCLSAHCPRLQGEVNPVTSELLMQAWMTSYLILRLDPNWSAEDQVNYLVIAHEDLGKRRICTAEVLASVRT